MTFYIEEDRTDDVDPLLSPEQKLWFRVLESAVVDAMRGGKGMIRIQRAKAQRWFLSAKNSAGSFLWIVEHLDIKYPQKILYLVFHSQNEEQNGNAIKLLKGSRIGRPKGRKNKLRNFLGLSPEDHRKMREAAGTKHWRYSTFK